MDQAAEPSVSASEDSGRFFKRGSDLCRTELTRGRCRLLDEKQFAEELLQAIETVLENEVYVSPAITSVALHRFAGHRTAPSGLDVLGDRELAVFSLIGAGHRTGQIAQDLGISRKTVEAHCDHIKSKLGYRDAETLRRAASELFGGSDRTTKQNP